MDSLLSNVFLKQVFCGDGTLEPSFADSGIKLNVTFESDRFS